MSGLASNNRLAPSTVDVKCAAPTQLVSTVKIDASQLAWMLERRAVAAAGYVIVMVDADASVAALHKPSGQLEQSQAKLHPEPLGWNGTGTDSPTDRRRIEDR